MEIGDIVKYTDKFLNTIQVQKTSELWLIIGTITGISTYDTLVRNTTVKRYTVHWSNGLINSAYESNITKV